MYMVSTWYYGGEKGCIIFNWNYGSAPGVEHVVVSSCVLDLPLLLEHEQFRYGLSVVTGYNGNDYCPHITRYSTMAQANQNR